jgi:beta-galactosidase
MFNIVLADSIVRLSSPDVEFNFNRHKGLIEQYRFRDYDIIKPGYSLKPDFWRAATDNDFGSNLPVELKIWKTATSELKLTDLIFDSENPRIIKITANYKIPGLSCSFLMEYLISGNGELCVTQKLIAGNKETVPMIPRFGANLILPGEFSEIQYFGRGPLENYPDRNYSADVSLYTQSVSEQYFPYIRPQETGNKTDIRWYRIFTKNNFGIMIEADTLFSATALNYLTEDLDDGFSKQQRHAADLKPRDLVQLNIDYKRMGLGGVDSWGTLPLQKYCLPYRNYTFKFKITPFEK